MKQETDHRLKNYRSLLNILVVATLFLSIGYAQITASDLQISGIATAYQQEGVYVSNVAYGSSSYANTETSFTKQRVGATIESQIFLNNNQNASITYQITTTNRTTKPYIYIGPSVSEHFYSNTDIEYDVSGINVGDVIDPNDDITFNLTYSFAQNAQIYANETELDAYINFGFREGFPITYSNIQGTGYPEYVINYKTSDNQPVVLNVDFGSNAPEELIITGVDTNTTYVLGTDYTYQNGVLNFPNVAEPLNVAAPLPNEPPVMNSVGEEQQTTSGSVKVTFSATDDYGVDHYVVTAYRVVNGTPTQAATQTVAGTATEYTFTGLSEGTYYFEVTVYDAKGESDSGTTASKEYRWVYNATINITNGGPNGTTTVNYMDTFSTTLTVNNGYNGINNLTVSMGGITLNSGEYNYNTNSGAVSIDNVTGDIQITGTASGNNVCLIEGTKVKLANGEEKNIEDIDYDDLLLVWSYEEGRVVEEYPLWIEKGKKANEYTKITFSDSSTINIYYDHAFFSGDENKFVNVQDEKLFHVGTHILKVNKKNELKEVEVVKIETIQEDVNYYFVASTRYYNIISDDFITTDAYTDITNLYPFNSNITWKYKSNEELDYSYLEGVLPYYMYKGFRAGEVMVLLNQNKTSINDFRDYIEYIVLAEHMHKQPTTKNGSRYWPVKVEGKWNKQVYIKEGTYYHLPMDRSIKYWYSTSENKYYKPGERVQVWTGMYFEKVK